MSKGNISSMKEPILVIMAAGMGSRFGGPKQIEPIGKHGELLIDYSIYDAIQAGFQRVVCILKEDILSDFKEIIGDRIAKMIELNYAMQKTDSLPVGFSLPKGRKKPWGTGHAILSAKKYIDAPFAVINADDFYGADGFRKIYSFLKNCDPNDNQYAMIGYLLKNTLTEHGQVARGICCVEDSKLLRVTERTQIEKHNGQAEYTEDNKQSWHPLDMESCVSMNFWGFTPGFLSELSQRFPVFLESALKENPLKAEYFLPTAVSQMLSENKAAVKVFPSEDRWYGMTYRDDKKMVQDAVFAMIEKGIYPENLWKS